MKVMVVWKTVPGKYKTAIDQFLSKGGPVPPGAKTVGRWHTPGSTLGWHLIEASDLSVVALGCRKGACIANSICLNNAWVLRCEHR